MTRTRTLTSLWLFCSLLAAAAIAVVSGIETHMGGRRRDPFHSPLGYNSLNNDEQQQQQQHQQHQHDATRRRRNGRRHKAADDIVDISIAETEEVKALQKPRKAWGVMDDDPEKKHDGECSFVSNELCRTCTPVLRRMLHGLTLYMPRRITISLFDLLFPFLNNH